MACTGRPPVQINPKELTALAAQGLTNREIMRCLGISEETFYKKKRQLKEFNEALEEGRAKGTAKIANALFTKAAAGDNACMFFYLERKAGWVKQEKVAVSGKINQEHGHKHGPDDDEIGPALREILSGFGFLDQPDRPMDPAPGESEA